MFGAAPTSLLILLLLWLAPMPLGHRHSQPTGHMPILCLVSTCLLVWMCLAHQARLSSSPPLHPSPHHAIHKHRRSGLLVVFVRLAQHQHTQDRANDMFSRFGTSLLRQSTRRVPAAVRPTTGKNEYPLPPSLPPSFPSCYLSPGACFNRLYMPLRSWKGVGKGVGKWVSHGVRLLQPPGPLQLTSTPLITRRDERALCIQSISPSYTRVPSSLQNGKLRFPFPPFRFLPPTPLLTLLHPTPSQPQIKNTGRRFLGGGGHGHGDHFHVSETHQKVATVMTTVCWVWILWRCYEDGAVVLGLKHPWDGHGGHGDHGHGGGAHYKEAGFDAPSELEEAEEEEEEGHGHGH